MFVKTPKQSHYTRDGQQRCRGEFLVVFSSADDQYLSQATTITEAKKFDRLWCCARKAKLEQLGHFMMGGVDLLGHHFGLSGGFGSDGLPMDWRAMRCTDGNWDHYDLTPDQILELKDRVLTPIPEHLSTLYWTSGGHNEVGAAADPIRAWALEHFKELTKVRRGGPYYTFVRCVLTKFASLDKAVAAAIEEANAYNAPAHIRILELGKGERTSVVIKTVTPNENVDT